MPFYMRREGTVGIPDVPLEKHAGIAWAQDAAKEHGVWLLAGSVRALDAGRDKAANRSVLLAPDGKIFAAYDKLHLFDVTLEGGQSYRESSQAVHGEAPVLARTPLAALGMTICYDVRFPRPVPRAGAGGGAGAERALGLHRAHRPGALARAAAGPRHRECVLRDRPRAMRHPSGRAGKPMGTASSSIRGGRIVAERSEETPGIITAEIDTARIDAVRAQLPVLQHHRALAEVKVF